MPTSSFTFTTTAGQTIDRELLIAYLNTGTSTTPVWSALGTRVEDSSQEYDWQEETITDILGVKRSTMKKPTITQTFDPSKLDSADTALKHIWDLAVKDQDYSALAAQDMLIVHLYASDGQTTPGFFAERYSACMVKASSLGGEGGGDIAMPIDVTYGGTRTTGTATRTSAGVVTFTAAT
mgnify:CR=1 FL=1